MSRRRAARRIIRTVIAVLSVGVLSASLKSTDTLVTPVALTNVDTLTLGSGSFFRPAGEVLKRTRAASTIRSLPFQADTAGLGSRESLSRWNRVYSFSRQYKIGADLAGKIFDAAVHAGIEPELGFRIVRIESEFKVTATSPVGAVGLMQIMPATARGFEPDITIDELYDVDTNLRIGFKYLRGLIRQYKGDVKLALLVYNRGPVAVDNALALGIDPTNGYEHAVMRGYKGRGILD